MAAPPPPAMTTPVPMPAVPAVEQQPMAVAAQPQVAMMPAAAQPQVAMMQAPAPVMPMAMVPQPTWAASVAHVEKLPDGQMRQRMTIGSGGVDACCRLMEAGKVDRSLFSTGEIIKVGLALPANAFTDGGAKRDAVVKSNSARTRLRNVEGGHKFRVLGLSTVNETERPVACAYLCSTLLLSLNVKPDNCAESFSTATRLARNTQDKRVGGQPLQSASARRPLDELSPEVVKEHLVRNPHLMTQALNDPRCHGARTVVIQSQLLKARPQLESLTGVLGFVVPRDALDRLVLPAMKEVGRVLGGVLIANVPRYATTWREDQQVVPPAIVSGATFNQQPEGGADGMGEDGAPGTPGNPGAVRHRGPALSSGQKKEILKTIVAHPDRLPTSRSLVREKDRVELQNQTGMPVEDLSRHRKIARRDGEGYLRAGGGLGQSIGTSPGSVMKVTAPPAKAVVVAQGVVSGGAIFGQGRDDEVMGGVPGPPPHDALGGHEGVGGVQAPMGGFHGQMGGMQGQIGGAHMPMGGFQGAQGPMVGLPGLLAGVQGQSMASQTGGTQQGQMGGFHGQGGGAQGNMGGANSQGGGNMGE